MKSTLDLPFPPRWVNAFVERELGQYEDIGIRQNYIPAHWRLTGGNIKNDGLHKHLDDPSNPDYGKMIGPGTSPTTGISWVENQQDTWIEDTYFQNGISPIVATSPTNVEELYNNLLQSFTVGEPLMIIYDRLITFRPTPFYPHKREQLVYYLYSTNLQNVNNAYVVISQLLDREDVSAQELNNWIRNNNLIIPGTGTNPANPAEYYPKNVRFHNTKVYVAQESRDLLDLASARTMYVNKLIIEYDYTQIAASEHRTNPGLPSQNYM